MTEETFDLSTFFRRIQAEYPNCVAMKFDNSGTSARLVIKEEDSPDHQHIECTIADDISLTLGLGQYMPWKYVKEEHVRQAIRYAFTWLNRYIPGNKIVDGCMREQKLDYSKMVLGDFPHEAFANAKGMADALDTNKNYLLTHFGEMELSQGIAFLLKLHRLAK